MTIITNMLYSTKLPTASTKVIKEFLQFQAEEITLTIGQAFDLAYRRFLDTSGREMENKREIMVLQKRVAELENENSDLRRQLNMPPASHTTEVKVSKSVDNDTDLLICPPVPPRDSANVANSIFAYVTYFNQSFTVGNQFLEYNNQCITNGFYREFAKTANEIEKRAQETRGKVDGLLFDVEDDNVMQLDQKPSRGSPDGIEAPPRSN